MHNFTSARSSEPEFGNFKGGIISRNSGHITDISIVSIFGDWGYGKNGKAISTRKALEKIKTEVDFIWHVGDIGERSSNAHKLDFQTTCFQAMLTTPSYTILRLSNMRTCTMDSCNGSRISQLMFLIWSLLEITKLNVIRLPA